MTQKRSSIGIIAIILLGILALALSWFDTAFLSSLSLKWIPNIEYSSLIVYRILPLITSLPMFLCAIFTATEKKRPACVTGIIGCVLNSSIAIIYVIANYMAWAGIITAFLAFLACILTMVAASGKHRNIGFVLLTIAVISLALSVWGCFFYTGKSGLFRWYSIFNKTGPSYSSYYGYMYPGLSFLPFSRSLLYFSCTIGVLSNKSYVYEAKKVKANKARVYQGYVYSGPTMPGLFAVSQGKAILLSIITLGIYGRVWQYRLIRNTHVIAEEDTSCTREFLLCFFVPFYSLYWVYTRQKKIAAAAKRRGYAVQAHPALHLWLLGGIISTCMLQETFNRLSWGQIPLIQQPSPAPQPVQSPESLQQSPVQLYKSFE